MKKVLITGAFGFVGSNLSVYLAERGYELWALDVEGPLTESRRAQSVYKRRFDWGRLEEIAWDEVDAVVHLAGKAHDTRNASDPQSYFDVNVGLTQRVLEMFSRQGASGFAKGYALTGKAQRGVRKFVLFSSVKAVADSVEGVLTEEATPAPRTAYGQSKLEAESLLRPLLRPPSGLNDEVKREPPSRLRQGFDGQGGLNDEVKREGGACPVFTLEFATTWWLRKGGKMRAYALRPCMIHGPGNKGNLNLLHGVVRKGVPWPLGAFENERSFASIGNVCAVVQGLISGDVEGGVYQVADDEPLSTNSLIELMAETLGRKARVWRLPRGLICFGARVGDLLRLPLNSERLKKLSESYVVSNAKIKGALGWERMPVGAREGMRRTLESWGKLGKF